MPASRDPDLLGAPPPRREAGDRLQRFLFERFPVRGHLVHLDAAWRALIEHHDYPEVIRNTLGEATAAAVLMVATLKFEGTLTLQMQGPGPMHLLVAHCTDHLAVRGVARWHESPTTRELSALTGGGQVTVTLDSPDRSARYQGIVPLSGQRIADCLEDYFRRSEQLPTRLWLAATADRATGLLLQRLPSGARGVVQEDLLAEAAADLDWDRILKLADTLSDSELLELPGREVLRRLFHQEDVRLFEPAPVFFQCTCSRERVAGILRSLGRGELEQLLVEQKRVEVRCEFCNRAYRFDAVDVASLFAETAGARAPGLH
jgi:molecular chaperone Hsp33